MQVGEKCKIYHKCSMLAGNVSRNQEFSLILFKDEILVSLKALCKQ